LKDPDCKNDSSKGHGKYDERPRHCSSAFFTSKMRIRKTKFVKTLSEQRHKFAGRLILGGESGCGDTRDVDENLRSALEELLESIFFF
jgi:hypothetical protein